MSSRRNRREFRVVCPVGGEPYHTLCSAKEAETKTHEIFSDSVVFLSSTKLGEPGGTGFVATMHDTDGASGTYLVTARHVVAQPGENPRRMWLRAQVKQEPCIKPRDIPANEWICHPDDSVDLAAADLSDVCENLSYYPIEITRGAETARIITAKNISMVAVGEPILVAGLFTGNPGKVKNQPIFRFGHIAGIPSEPFQIDEDLPEMMGYLVEMQSLGGMSGSPVFIRPHDIRMIQTAPFPGNSSSSPEVLRGPQPVLGYPYMLWLLGVLNAHWELPRHTDKGETIYNTGISAVTPAARIVELLNEEVFLMARKERKDDRNPVRATLDSAAPN